MGLLRFGALEGEWEEGDETRVGEDGEEKKER